MDVCIGTCNYACGERPRMVMFYHQGTNTQSSVMACLAPKAYPELVVIQILIRPCKHSNTFEQLPAGAHMCCSVVMQVLQRSHAAAASLTALLRLAGHTAEGRFKRDAGGERRRAGTACRPPP